MTADVFRDAVKMTFAAYTVRTKSVYELGFVYTVIRVDSDDPIPDAVGVLSLS